MVRRSAIALLFLFVALIAAGGDIAMFENLGFSGDSRVFLFGQYGIDAADSAPFAELYVVDVPSNSFVPDGVFTNKRTGVPLSLGQDGRGSLFGLIGEAQDLITKYDIDHLSNGRPIYILVDGETPKDRIEFRDFNTNTRYAFVLSQDQRTRNDTVEASFHIALTVTYPDDRSRTVTIGREGYYRPEVSAYRITQVLLSPDENSIVVVVEKLLTDGSIRYMVETAPLD